MNDRYYHNQQQLQPLSTSDPRDVSLSPPRSPFPSTGGRQPNPDMLLSPDLQRHVASMPPEDADVLVWHTNRLAQIMQEGARIADAYNLQPVSALLTHGVQSRELAPEYQQPPPFPRPGGVGPTLQPVGPDPSTQLPSKLQRPHPDPQPSDEPLADVFVPDAAAVRLLMLSAPAIGMPLESFRRMERGIVRREVTVVSWDDHEPSLASLAAAARRAMPGKRAHCIGFLTPTGPGVVELFNGIFTSEQSLRTDPDVRQFWAEMGHLLQPGGRIDLLGAFAAEGPAGEALLQALGRAAGGAHVAASAGNAPAERFLLMEPLGGHRILVGPAYFLEATLDDWQRQGREQQQQAPPPPQAPQDEAAGGDPGRTRRELVAAEAQPKWDAAHDGKPQAPARGAPRVKVVEPGSAQPCARMGQGGFIALMMVVLIVICGLLGLIGYLFQFQLFGSLLDKGTLGGRRMLLALRRRDSAGRPLAGGLRGGEGRMMAGGGWRQLAGSQARWVEERGVAFQHRNDLLL